MANRVVVTICGEDYTFVAEESPSYMQKVGAYVGDKMDEVLNSTRVGKTDAAVLTHPGGQNRRRRPYRRQHRR